MKKELHILFDIGHPAHFHLFKHFMHHLAEKKIFFSITTRDKEITNTLIENQGFEYISISKPGDNILGMLWNF